MDCIWCFEEVKVMVIIGRGNYCSPECAQAGAEFENQFKKEEPITAPEVYEEGCRY